MVNVIMGLVDYGYSLLCFQPAVLDSRLLLIIYSPFLYFQTNIITGLLWGGTGQVNAGYNAPPVNMKNTDRLRL